MLGDWVEGVLLVAVVTELTVVEPLEGTGCIVVVAVVDVDNDAATVVVVVGDIGMQAAMLVEPIGLV